MEASGPAVETKCQFMHRGHVGQKGNSSVQGAYASRQAGKWEIANHWAAKNNAREAPANPNKQDIDMIQVPKPYQSMPNTIIRYKILQIDIFLRQTRNSRSHGL